MEYYENVLGLIGRTPLVKLNRLTHGLKATVLAKMENLNPGASVKDRIGVAMIEAAEGEGKLKPGGTISRDIGNTASASRSRGGQRLRCIFVMTDSLRSKGALPQGARCGRGRDARRPSGHARPLYFDRARIAAETPNSFYPTSTAPANPAAHYARRAGIVELPTERSRTSSQASPWRSISGLALPQKKNPNIKSSVPTLTLDFKTYKEPGISFSDAVLVEGSVRRSFPKTSTQVLVTK